MLRIELTEDRTNACPIPRHRIVKADFRSTSRRFVHLDPFASCAIHDPPYHFARLVWARVLAVAGQTDDGDGTQGFRAGDGRGFPDETDGGAEHVGEALGDGTITSLAAATEGVAAFCEIAG
jgi:hypothetical protein